MTLSSSLRKLKYPTKHVVVNLRLQSSLCQTKHLIQPHDILKLQPHYAHHLFDDNPLRNLSEYSHRLFELSRNDHNQEALYCYKFLHLSGLAVVGSTVSCVLKVCGVLLKQVVGRQVHCQCVKSGCLEDVSVGTALTDMYMKTDNFFDGREIFNEMGYKNVVSWTTLIVGYARNGFNDEVIDLLSQMLMEGVKPNDFTFATVLGALADGSMMEEGIQVHALIVKNGFELTTSVCNALISMYMKSELVEDAEAVFDSMLIRDVVTWNGMIAGYAAIGFDLEGFEMFYRMRLAGVMLTQMIFCTVIKLCSRQRELNFTKQIHCGVMKNGYEFDQNVRTALMVTYSKCGTIDDASKLFSSKDGDRNVVTWTAMISGYAQNNNNEQAANLFCQMNREGVRPNHFTYSAVLAGQPALFVFQLHAQVIKANFEKLPSVGTALLDAYVKTGNAFESARVFYSISEKDIVAWSAMLAGLAQIGVSEEAIEVFIRLQHQNMVNKFTQLQSNQD